MSKTSVAARPPFLGARASMLALALAVGLEVVGLHALSTDPAESQAVAAADGATVYSRMIGALEDPATGSASGPLGCYLVRYGIVPLARAGDIVSVQGVKMNRPSRVHIRIDAESPERITRVRVGGGSVLVGEGRLRPS